MTLVHRTLQSGDALTPVIGCKQHVGTFSHRTSAGTLAVTGVGFQPKVLFFFEATGTAVGGINLGMHFGACDASLNQWAHLWTTNDTVVPTVGTCLDDVEDVAISVATLAAGHQKRASVTSMDSDGFTLSYSFASSNGFACNYLALGGEGVEAFVGTFSAGSSTGTTAVTGPNFEPNSVIVVHRFESGEAGVLKAGYGLGYSDQDLNQFSSFQRTPDPGTNVFSVQRTDSVACAYDGSTVYRLEVDSYDNSGFTVDCVTSISAIHHKYIAFRNDGGTHVGTFTTPGSTGSHGYTGVGFSPDAVLFSSFGNVATPSGSQTLNMRPSVGLGATGGGGVASTGYHRDNPGSVTYSRSLAFGGGNVIHPFGTASTSTTQNQADYTSSDTDGFTLNWIDVTGTSYEYGYLAIGHCEAS